MPIVYLESVASDGTTLIKRRLSTKSASTFARQLQRSINYMLKSLSKDHRDRLVNLRLETDRAARLCKRRRRFLFASIKQRTQQGTDQHG